MPRLSAFESTEALLIRFNMAGTTAHSRYDEFTERPPVDWSKPVQFNDGTPCTAERVSGFILVTFDPDARPAGMPDPRPVAFRDSLVCYEGDGSIYGCEDAPCWVENVGRKAHPIASIFATF